MFWYFFRQRTSEISAVYRCGLTIANVTVGDLAVMGVALFLFAFLVSS